jgi:hypothetical protein
MSIIVLSFVLTHDSHPVRIIILTNPLVLF